MIFCCTSCLYTCSLGPIPPVHIPSPISQTFKGTLLLHPLLPFLDPLFSWCPQILSLPSTHRRLQVLPPDLGSKTLLGNHSWLTEAHRYLDALRSPLLTSLYLHVLQRQFMSLVGQYDMDLFTTIFSLLFVPVPGFSLGTYDPFQVRHLRPSPPLPSPHLPLACALWSMSEQWSINQSGSE